MRRAIFGLVVIVSSLVFLCVGVLVGTENIPEVQNLVLQASVINPIHIYDINTNCELYYFVLEKPIPDRLPASQQELEAKYPVEYLKIMHAIQTPEYAQYISTHDSTKMPLEMSEAMASILIKSNSINPKLEPVLVEISGIESNDALYSKIQKEDPDCAKKIKGKLEPEVPLILQIDSMVKGGAAEKAGLLKGDIITAINGTHISFVSDLSKLKLIANKTVIVSIIRDGKTMQIPVLLSPAVDDPQKGTLGILRSQNQAKTP